MSHFLFRIFHACLFLLSTSLLAQPASFEFVVDGVLDDPIWKECEPERLMASQTGLSQEMGGEIRTTIVGRYLYLAARLPEPSGRITARMTGRNPNWEDEDLLRIVLGPDIGYTDREVKINPLGAYSVERNGQFVHLGADEYLVATRVAKQEWTVELAFPLNLVSAPSSDPILLSVERIRAARPGSPQQRWNWPEYGPVAKASVTSDDWDLPAPPFRPLLIGDGKAPLEVGYVRKLPPLESGWQEYGWRDARALPLLRDEPAARLPRFPTEVKLIHDGKTLAILAKCQEPEGILVPPPEPRGRRVGAEDSFSVYLSTSGSSYAQLSINPLGSVREATGMTGGSRVSRPREWRSGVCSLVRRTSGTWTVRMDIPLQETSKILGETRLPPEWRALLIRSRPRRNGEPLEVSALPVIQSDTPRCPARYLRLLLSEREPSAFQIPEIDTPEALLPPFETRVLSSEQRSQLDLASMLERRIRQRVQKIMEEEDETWERIETLVDWERFRDPRLKALADSLGPFPAAGRTQMRMTKEFLGSGYRRQDLVYLSRPGLWVTANLYLPVDPLPKMPGILIVHSHHRPRTQAELQDMGILWARVGCAVLIMDQIGHGERIQNYPWNREAYHSRSMIGMQMYLAGESLVKWMVGDILRGVDLLVEREDIDPDRIVLMGAVAGGGDPAAVAAALDPRIAVVAPFNFVRTGAGWGEWESTRCLRRSIIDRFFPWVIDASVAPRRLVYANEMGWESYGNHQAWERYQRVFAFFGAPHHLDEAHGLGTFPGPGECSNIGPDQRKTMYPELNRWFGIPVPPAEPDDRRPESELASLTPEVASDLQMKDVHELVGEVAREKLGAARAELRTLSPAIRREKLKADWAEKLGDIEPNDSPDTILHWTKNLQDVQVEGLTLETEPGVIVPLLLLWPERRDQEALPPVVVALSQGGKERVLGDHGSQVLALLKAGIAVCLPDVRGVGETSPDSRRGPDGEETTLSATEFMLGNTLLGSRLKDLRTVLGYLGDRTDLNADRIGIWGDSHVPPNPARLLLDEIPQWQIGPVIQQQAEPLGGLLALLAGLYEENIQVIAVRGGLINYLTILDDNFVYVPNDVIVPGILEAGDIGDVMEVLSPRPLLLQALVDGRNRLVPASGLDNQLASVYAAYQVSPQSLVITDSQDVSEVIQWFIKNLQTSQPLLGRTKTTHLFPFR